MKALVYTSPETLEYLDVTDPTLRDGEVLVKIDSVGICGSDMHAFLGHDDRRPAPLILGHEVSGTIEGEGTRVTLNPLVTCGECRACLSGRDNLCPKRQIISMQPREGGFAQYVAIPRANAVVVPDGFSLETAAMAEPIACGWHAVKIAKRTFDGSLKNKSCLVIGGGAIGVGAALSLIAQDAIVTVIEPNSMRRDYLNAQGELNVIAPDDLSDKDMFEVVIDGVGFAQTRATASKHTLPGGLIMHIGLGSAEGGIDIRRLTLQEITFIGTYTYTAEDFRTTARAMFDGRLGALKWFETRPLSQGLQAFVDIRNGGVQPPKILLKP